MKDKILSRHLNRDDEYGEQRKKAANGKDIYAAFGVRNKAIAIDIRKADGAGQCPGYISFVDIFYNSKYENGFVLTFDHVVVDVKGLHLNAVIRAVKARRCEFLEEISGEFEPPKDGEAVIHSITFDDRWKRQAANFDG